jgi:hypothetical protein
MRTIVVDKVNMGLKDNGRMDRISLGWRDAKHGRED